MAAPSARINAYTTPQPTNRRGNRTMKTLTETRDLFAALKSSNPREAILVMEDFLLRRQEDLSFIEQSAIWHGMLELHRGNHRQPK